MVLVRIVLMALPPFDVLQRIAMTAMSVLVMLTFLGANMQAMLWQSSTWLVSTVLPAVVVNLTNEERDEVAAPLLRRSKLLDQAATAKAEHMAEHEYLDELTGPQRQYC
jgi:uncharacterized protein YkwD